MRVNKKGALELSINSIVIIVLAFTLLGLGLMFVRKTINDMTKTSTDVNAALRDQIMEDLRTSDKRLAFPTPQIEMKSNAAELISIGVKNVLDSTLRYKVKIYDVNYDNTNNNPLNCGDATHEYKPSTKALDKKCAAFYWSIEEQQLSSGQSRVVGIKIFAPNDFNTYQYKIAIVDSSNQEYDSKTFFVSVT